MSRPLCLLAAVLVLAAAGCGGGGSKGDSATTLKLGQAIGMRALRFHPDAAQVKVGQTVTWRNEESVPHNVVAQSGAVFESETFGKDGTFSWTPRKTGTVKYECTLHPGMTGTVDVVAK